MSERGPQLSFADASSSPNRIISLPHALGPPPVFTAERGSTSVEVIELRPSPFLQRERCELPARQRRDRLVRLEGHVEDRNQLIVVYLFPDIEREEASMWFQRRRFPAPKKRSVRNSAGREKKDENAHLVIARLHAWKSRSDMSRMVSSRRTRETRVGKDEV